MEFRLVYPNPDESPAATRQHLTEYNYQLPALLDHKHRLVKEAQIRTTPECAVYTPDSGWVYHGRIDNRDADLGKLRSQPTKRDLQEVLTAIANGQKVTPYSTVAVGCTIAPIP
jgi:hypothetical protein